jgi:hypothetical protein
LAGVFSDLMNVKSNEKIRYARPMGEKYPNAVARSRSKMNASSTKASAGA